MLSCLSIIDILTTASVVRDVPMGRQLVREKGISNHNTALVCTLDHQDIQHK